MHELRALFPWFGVRPIEARLGKRMLNTIEHASLALFSYVDGVEEAMSDAFLSCGQLLIQCRVALYTCEKAVNRFVREHGCWLRSRYFITDEDFASSATYLGANRLAMCARSYKGGAWKDRAALSHVTVRRKV
jgi:hypothetical protein